MKLMEKSDKEIKIIAQPIWNNLVKSSDNKLPTAQMLGRWQPWHAGHQKLFES